MLKIPLKKGVIKLFLKFSDKINMFLVGGGPDTVDPTHVCAPVCDTYVYGLIDAEDILNGNIIF